MLNGFMRLTRDIILPVDQIMMIWAEAPPAGKYGLPTRKVSRHGDQADLTVEACEIDSLMLRPMQIMPAPSGWNLLTVSFDGQETHSFLTPVIGWAICFDGQMRPVTPLGVGDGEQEPDRGWYVRAPDGTVHATNGWTDYPSFDSVQIAVSRFREDYDAVRPASKPEEGQS